MRAREHNRPPSPPDRLPPRRGGRPSSQTASAAGGRGLVGFARGLAAAACLALFGALALPSTAEAQTAPVCDRTEQVRDAIVAAVPGVSACANVTTAHLAAITYLGLGSAGFTSLQAGDFSGLTALTYLDLGSNSLRNLPAVVFDGLTALETLDLGNNSLRNLPASVFDALTALQTLYLGNNSLSNLPASVFDALTALETLNLTSNSLSDLPASVFDALTALETLYLGNNSLSNLPASVFDGLTALETLSLGNNSLSDLPAGVFSGLTSLESLLLDGNPVSPLPVAVSLELAEPGRFRAVAPTAAPFALTLPVSVVYGEIDGGATTLTIPAGMVHSDSVSVTRIGGFAVTADIGTLPGLPSGHRGYALEKSSGLPLEVFAAAPFCDRTEQVRDAIVAAVPGVSACANVTTAHLAAITSLDLGSAGITSLQAGDFDGLTALTSLDLRSNSLSNLPAVVFDGLTALESLYLGSNSLSDLPASVFDALTALETLSLGDNSLGNLPASVFDALTALETLNLNSNSLSNLQAGVFDALTALETLYLGNNSLSNLPAGVFDGLTALTELSLNNNSLSNLPAGVFSGLTSLESLRLDGNPVSPLPVAVSLEPTEPGRFRAVAPTAAPFALTLPVSVVYGEIDGGATTLTIPAGMVHSDSVSVTRIGGFAVTADIGTLPGLPSGHRGYALEKSSGLPLEVFAAGPFCDRTEQVRDAIVAAVPGVSACANVTAAHLAAITSLDLGFAGITSLQAGDFSGLTALTYLDLRSNSLSDLPAVVFDALTALQFLYLNNNSLSDLRASVFDGLTALQALDLGSNSLSNLPAGVFDTLTALTELSLDSNSLSNLPASVFDGLTALQTLYLGNNSLSNLPAGVFDDLIALETLYLGNNSLSDLPAVVFDGLTALETLSLGNNSLSNLPAGVFDALTALTELSLNNNSLSNLPAGVFSGLTSLETLRLDGNPVSPLPVAVSLEPAEPGRFRAVAPTAAPFALTLPVSVVYGEIDGGATTLTIPTGMVHSDSVSVTRIGGFAVTADIGTLPGLPSGHRGYALEKSSGLPLEVFAAAPFCDRTEQVRDAIVAQVSGVSTCGGVTAAHLAAITGLDLDSTGISSLQAGDFDGLTALETLNLNDNSLSNLPASVFDTLTALETLYLGNNSLSDLQAGVFDTLTALTELSLDSNSLSNLPAGVFDDLIALETLYLSNNFLNDLPAGVFDALTALETLLLSYNSLGNLPAGVFDALTALETLLLNDNSLSNLPAGVFDGLTALESLFLGNNSLSNLQAGVFDALTALESLYLGDNSLSNLPAGVFDDLIALETLDLSDNSLSNLQAGVFSGLTSLEILRLDGNPGSPLPVAVSLEPVEPGRFRAVAPTAAPFALTLPVSVVNGEIDGEATTLTIPTGMVHSDSVSVTRSGGSAVTADIGTLPGLPSEHRGYALEKSSGLPLEVFAVNAAPSFTSSPTFDAAENQTAVGTVEASDDDAGDEITGYEINGGADAGFFSIGPTSGVLTFDDAPNFEDAQDQDAGNTYEVTVQATSGTGDREQTATQTITVRVTDDDTDPTCTLNTGDIWCGVVTVEGVASGDGFVDTFFTAGDLSDKTFSVGTGNYMIDSVLALNSGRLSFSLTGALTDAHRAKLELHVEDSSDPFAFIDANYAGAVHSYRWEGSGLDWSSETLVELHLWSSNNAPLFAETMATRTVPENSAAGTDVGVAVTATDADSGDTLTYSLEGTDAGSFTIDETSGQIRTETGVTYNYEAPKNSYSVTVKADDGAGGTDTIAVTINVTDDDTEAPSAPDAPSVSTASVTSLTVTWLAPDNAGPEITDYDYRYRTTSVLSVWVEVADTTITDLSATIGSLQENTSYDVQVRATNDEGTSDWSASGFSNAAPTFTSAATFDAAENQTAVGTVQAEDIDPGDAITVFAISGGADAGFFSISFDHGAGPPAGVLTFDDAPNFEDAQDADTDNAYVVVVRATSGKDARVMTADQTITVTVMDDDTEAPGAPDAPSVSPASVTSLNVSWSAPDNAGPEITDYDVQYRAGTSEPWSDGSHIGTALTAILTGLLEDTSYQVQVRATNAEGTSDWSASGSGATDANAAPTFTSDAAFNPAENQTTVGTVVASDGDTGDDITSYALTGGTDQSFFSIGSDSGVLTFNDAPNFEAPSDADTNGSYVVTVQATSGTGDREQTATQTITVTVMDDDTEAPSAPDAPSVSTASVTSLTVTWLAPDNAGPEITDYDYRYRTNSPQDAWVEVADTTITDLSATIGSLQENTSYDVQVRATNDEGTSDWSASGSSNAAPTFTSSPTFDAAENQTAVSTVQAEDNDPGDFITVYEITGGADQSFFSIGSDSGVLTFNDAPNFEAPSDADTNGSYVVTVQATSGTGAREKTATQTITVTVMDDDTEAPGAPDAPSVSPASVTSLNVSWSAPDNAGPEITDYDVQYRAGTSEPWSDGSHIGTALTAILTGLLEDTSYQVQVRATNAEGTGGWSASGSGATDANAAPSFTSSATFNPAENQTAVGTVQASDSDTGDAITDYALSGGADQALFSIGSTSGVLTFQAAPNYENPQDANTDNAYLVVVQATSGTGDREQTATQTITVTVMDDDDEAPGAPDAPSVSPASVTSLNVSWSAPDNAGPEITDYDVQYRAGTSEPWSDGSHIGTALTAILTGLLEDTSYQVQVRATNAEGTGGWSASGSGETDANAAPSFTSAAMFNPAENQTAVGTVVASDSDTGDAITDYALSGGADQALFAIGSTSGALTFQAAPNYEDPQDANTDNAYLVVVQATSGTGDREQTGTQTITVTVMDDDDEAPGAPDAPSVSPASVTSLNVSWSAPDNAGPEITDYDVQYRAGTSEPWSDGSHIGTALTAILTGLLEDTSYQVQVRATNAEGTGGWSASGSGATDANAAPSFTSAAMFNPAENQTAVGTVAASDSDAGDAITDYALSGGTDQALFAIGSTSGVLTFQAAPNYEDPQDANTDNAYLVTVQATSGTGDREQTATQTITVTVMDANEQPDTPATPTVMATSGTTDSLDVTWTEPGLNGGPAIIGYGVQYRVVPSVTWVNWTHSGTGTTTTITGLTASTEYQVRVQALNGETPSAWSDPSVAVPTNSAANNAPVFSETAPTRGVAENSAAGVDVGAAVTATDADPGDTLTYTLEGTDVASFDIVSTSGQIRTKTGVTYDHEEQSSYSVTVRASDGTASATIDVEITVTDEDEQPDKPAKPTVSATSGTTDSLDVTWTEPGRNGGPELTGYTVEYREGTSGDWENVTHSGTGTTTTITGLTANTEHQVRVQALNGETPSAWSDPSVAVPTNAAANNAPVFSETAPTRGVAENSAAGVDVGTAVTATDADPGDTLTYTLEGTDVASFDIVSTSGQIRTKTGVTYDHEEQSSYSVTVTVSDGTASATIDVAITVTDVDEQPDKPAKPTLAAVSGATDSLDASWTKPGLNGGPDITGYAVEYRQGTSGTWTNWMHTGTGTATTITGLTANTEYQVRVQALNGETPSDWSDPSDAATTVAAGPPATNAALLPPQDVNAEPLLPGEIRLGWWRNPDDASHELVDRHQYRYRVRDASTWTVDWTTVNQTMLPGTSEIRNYNSVLLKELTAWTTYEFQVRSVDKDGGTSAVVTALGTAVGRQTVWIEADTRSVEEGEPLRFALSRDQPHGRLMVILRISETGDMLPPEGRSPEGYWYENVHFGDGNATIPVVLDTVNDGGGPEPNSAVTVEVMPYPLAPDNPDKEHLYEVRPELRAGTATVTAAEGSSHGGAAEPLTAAFEGLPEAHDGETAFTVRLVFSEAVSVTPEAMRTRVLTVEGGAVTGAARVDGETGVWAITVTPDTREALSITLAPAAECAADGAVCTADGRALSTGASAIVNGPGPESQTEEDQALTASFEGVPEAHDGERAFRFHVAFSEDIGIDYQALRDDAFTVSGGAVTEVRGVDGRYDRWEITVAPDSDGDVAITLPAGRACEVSGAICTTGEHRRQLTNTPAATVAGPSDDALEPNTAASGAPTISGTPQVGEALTASTSGIDRRRRAGQRGLRLPVDPDGH